ncbi:hypothetical protein FOCC_FOCC016022 [Frankliniella occidentalis]|nr:hypothetical protein FOCC_FOCC016022 [Frankliniella occidentalis]
MSLGSTLRTARMGKALHTLAIIVATAVAFSGAAHLAVKDEDPFALPGVSAIQTEGAWDADGKRESSLDHVLHTGKLTSQGFPADPHLHDVVADSYHRYKEDVKMAKALGLQLYRFSISWSRVFFEGTRNEKGIQYYHDLIKEIKDSGMKPLMTLYHFDHPQTYEDEFKGWQSEKMVPKFVEYATFVFNEYGKEVDLWVTLNEPNMYCTYFPSLFVTAGLYKQEDINIYNCMRNFVLAHAQSYRAFKEAGMAGQIGLTVLLMHATPNSTRPEDVYAAELFNQVHAGQVLAPIVVGDYPQVLKDELSDKITEFTVEEKQLIKGSTDFVGFNIYFSMVASWKDPNTWAPCLIGPMMGKFVEDLPMASINVAGGIDVENPMKTFDRAYMRTLLTTMKEFKVDVIAYCAWSLIDSYEWSAGFGRPFGLVHVDYEGKTLDRSLKDSSQAYMRTLLTTMKEFKVDVIAYCAWSLIDSYEWSAGFGRPFGLVHVDYEGKTLDRSLKDSSQFGLYSAFAGGFVYMFLGTIKQVVIGPASIMSIITLQFTRDKPIPFLRPLLGLSFRAHGCVETLVLVARHASEVRVGDLVMGLTSMAFLWSFKALAFVPADPKRPLGKGLWFLSICKNGLCLTFATVAAGLLHHRLDGGVPFAVVGNMPPGLPAITLPPFQGLEVGNQTVSFLDMTSELGVGLVVTPVVAVLINIAIGKAYAGAAMGGGGLDASQELLALSACNVLCALVQGMPVSGALTRSAVAEASGVRTPLAGLYCSALIVAALAWLTPSFYFIPRPTLAAVLIVAVGSLIDVRIVPRLWRVNKRDFVVLVVTFFTCLWLGVEVGLVALASFANELGERGQRLILLDANPSARSTLLGAGLDQDAFCEEVGLQEVLREWLM